MPDALTADEFAALINSFAPLSDTIALAVSGGPDSMALAACVKRWAQTPCIALVVDHGLRPESAAEAEQVKKWLEQMGFITEVLCWQHAVVTSGIQIRARQARYQLLCDACRRHSAGDLLLAHQREDQAETILMRLAKGSGIDGVAGMAAESRHNDIRLLRPFLSLAKERLVATCISTHTTFVNDPSNDSLHYARGRLRKILPLLADEGLTIDNLISLGMRAREAKGALDHYTKEFLMQAAQVKIGGAVAIKRQALYQIPRAIALRAITHCLRYVHDNTHPPQYATLSSLLDRLIDPTDEGIVTLYGCIVTINKNHTTFLREPSAANEVLNLPSNTMVLWDERWLVTSSSTTPPVTIRALGNPPYALIDRLAPNLRRQIPQGRIRASLPALWQGQQLLALPSFTEKAMFHMVYYKQAFP